MSMMRMAVMGAGAAGAAGVAVFGGLLINSKTTETSPVLAEREICLKGDLTLFEGANAKCYSRAEFRALLDRPVMDRKGAPVSLMMSHPSDMSIASAACDTCREYREMTFDGWYASSSREMRREAYFVRACGALNALDKAQVAEKSYFTNGSPTAEEVVTMVSSMRFGEARASAEEIHVDQGAGHVWRINADAISVQIHEIANADFDNDGIEEILAFSSLAPADGSASFYDIGLIEKDSADATLMFTGLSYGRNEAGGVGG